MYTKKERNFERHESKIMLACLGPPTLKMDLDINLNQNRNTFSERDVMLIIS